MATEDEGIRRLEIAAFFVAITIIAAAIVYAVATFFGPPCTCSIRCG